MDTEKRNDKTCSYTPALFLHRLERCHEMWFLNAERTHTHLKKPPVHSAPILGVYNPADVFASHIFPLSASVQNTPGVAFCFTNKTQEKQSFSSSERSAFLQLLMMGETRLEDKDLYFDQYLSEQIVKSFCLFVFKGRGLSLKGMSPGKRNR